MNKILIVISLISAISFTSCETDIDVNAEYEDITIVYGAINPSDTTHYIKINKAFLGETNALDLAANADNYTYAADEITHTIEEYNENNNWVATHNVIRTTEIDKEAGTFDHTPGTNVLYKFEANFHPLAQQDKASRDHTFRLRIFNSELDKEITAETKIVKPITVSTPKGSKFQFWNGTVSSGVPVTKIVSATSGENIGRIEAKIVFNYIEHPLTITGKPSVEKSVKMSLGEIYATTSQGNQLMEWQLDGETFFDNIKSAINPITTSDSLSHRELANISMEFSVAGTELHTYMVVSEPSSSVNQDKPSYTNIENGVGIFSAREFEVWESTIDPQSQNQVNIQNSTIKFLESLNRGFCYGTIGLGFPVAPCTQQ
ncbi:MAG: hypothetical protein P1U41_02535 [Vicingaceae bacterium]|nr:hypothetical protein [Vicingaceae bacterium]